MQIFLDSADIKEIDEINQLGIIDGITTNPTLISKEKNDFSYDRDENIFSKYFTDSSNSPFYQIMFTITFNFKNRKNI